MPWGRLIVVYKFTSAFARHMPVSRTGIVINKYIRFQCFAEPRVPAPETAQSRKTTQTHTGNGNFIRWTHEKTKEPRQRPEKPCVTIGRGACENVKYRYAPRMDLLQKIRTIPTEPGVYLYKNAEGEVIYVGKAKNLRSRVASYFHEGRWEDAKTGTLVREAVDVDYIVVANNKEALALENNLIKQRKPRFNILLRDDKTYPYVKLTLGERWPRVYVTRRLRKDGSSYYGPYFPGNLAYRIVDLIHRNFLIPSCKVDLTRFHPRPCLQYYIKRCLGPCVKDLTTPDTYQEAVRDVKLFLEGRPTDLSRSLHARMEQAAAAQEYERAARYRDLISTVEQLQERQRLAAAEGDDADVFGYHYENGMVAVNLFHMRAGKMVDRREFFWEDLPEFGVDSDPEPAADDVGEETQVGRPFPHEPQRPDVSFHPGEFFSALLKQLYIGQPYVPRNLYVPVDFEDRAELEDLLSEQAADKSARPRAFTFSFRSAATSVRSSTLRETMRSNPTTSAFACSNRTPENPGRITGRTHLAGTAQAHRVLRHLAYPGRGDRRLHGGVGRRQDEKVGLPQVHHPHG